MKKIIAIILLTLLLPQTTFGALDFDSAGSSRRVNHGTAASLTNLARGASGMTAWAWVYRTSNGSNQEIITKDGTGGTGFNFVLDNSPSEGSLRMIIFRTAITDYVSAGGEIPLNTWKFIAVTFDDAASPEVRIYTGGLTSIAREVSYSTQTNGSGTPTDDSGVDVLVGNVVRAATNPFRGRIARGGLFNRALSIGEIKKLQFSSYNMSGAVLLFDYFGTGVQPDRSGSRNNSNTVEAVSAPHVPLKSLFGR